MLAKVIKSRVVARTALAGCAAGLVTLVALTLRIGTLAQAAAGTTSAAGQLHTLQLLASVVGALDLTLLVWCGVALLGCHRHADEQAASSQHQALHDSLTGLANRVLLGDRAGQAVRSADRHGEMVGLVLFDLNRFKEVNDTLGHHYGDLLLEQVAARLQRDVREMDTVARLGGDEFAVLLTRLGSEREAMQVAERLLQGLQELPVHLDGLLVEVTASAGVAVYPTQSGDAEQLLQHADIAMYTAKRAQLGVALYDAGLDGHSPRQLTLLGELRHGIDTGQLVVHYQPKAKFSSGEICGVEALVRWQHPDHGLLPPAEFIPLADQGGQIEALTRFVLAAALDQCRSWQQDGWQLPVAVNVAARCLLNPEFAHEVAELLAVHEVPAAQLTLEITESAIIGDPSRALEVLDALRRLGVRISIDDFGTGYSSMAYLRALPLDELKIDRCFVTHMRDEASNQAIVRAVLELARNLDLQVVAEGIEDEQTWAALAALGCDIGQGYHLSRPAPAAQVSGWLAGRSVAAARPVG